MYTIVCVRSEEDDRTLDRPPAGLLTPDEAAVLAGLKTTKRRHDWLTGRYAAKHLVQHAIREETGQVIPFSDFAILKKETGAPTLVWPGKNGYRPVSLSISHTGQLAYCALAFHREAFLGCDVEQISPRSPAFIADYFTPAEQALVHQAPRVQKAMLANTIWSAKEAVLKALELGLTVDTRAVTCLPERDRSPEYRPFSITLDTNRIARPVPALTGRWWVRGDYVFTLVAPATLLDLDLLVTWEIPYFTN